MYPTPRPTPLSHAVMVILRLVALFLVLAAVVLVITSFMFFLPNPPQVDTAGSNFGLRFDQSNLAAYLDGNLSLTIHGLYKVEDVHVTLHAINATGFTLANAVQGPFTLVPNVPHREHVVLALNIGNWLRTAWPLTHDDQLTLTLGLQGRYTTGLIRATFGLTSVLPWQAPLRSYSFDTKNSTFTTVPPNVRWSVPYKLNTTAFLSGPATIAVEVANESSTITSSTTAVILGGPISGLMNFTLSPAQAQELSTTNHTLKVTIRVTLANGLSATVVQFIPWTRRFP